MQFKIKAVLLSLLLVVGSSFAADQTTTTTTTTTATAPAQTSNTFSDPKQIITVNAATPTVTIRLESNRTTGYSWFVKKLDRQDFKIEKHIYVAPHTQMAGSPGYEEWTLTVKPALFKPKRVAKITFIYARPWEKKAGKEITFTVKSAA